MAAAAPAASVAFLAPGEAKAMTDGSVLRWAFLVDTEKCVGCGLCVDACKTENEIPYDAPVSRTWIERYVITRDG
jgi:Fe-S-cluster-containing dehydrogenase component